MHLFSKREFEVSPFVGAGGVRFGMSPSDVEAVLGVPDRVSKSYFGNRREYRSFMNVGYDEVPRANHIGFGRQMESVTLGAINFFKDDPFDVLHRLIAMDGKPWVELGFVVFLDIGIALTGFHDDAEDDKAVSLFEKGAWDLTDRAKEFRL